VDSAPATNSAPIDKSPIVPSLRPLQGSVVVRSFFSRVGATRNVDEVRPLCVTLTLCRHVQPIGMALKVLHRHDLPRDGGRQRKQITPGTRHPRMMSRRLRFAVSELARATAPGLNRTSARIRLPADRMAIGAFFQTFAIFDGQAAAGPLQQRLTFEGLQPVTPARRTPNINARNSCVSSISSLSS